MPPAMTMTVALPMPRSGVRSPFGRGVRITGRCVERIHEWGKGGRTTGLWDPFALNLNRNRNLIRLRLNGPLMSRIRTGRNRGNGGGKSFHLGLGIEHLGFPICPIRNPQCPMSLEPAIPKPVSALSRARLRSGGSRRRESAPVQIRKVDGGASYTSPTVKGAFSF